MEDPFGVRRGQRVSKRETGVDEHGRVHRAASETLMQRLAVEQFHHQEGHRRGADVVNGANPGVVERRNGLRLALEALERVTSRRRGGP